jgi:hypothetical protein
MVCHRVAARTSPGPIDRGDGSQAPDPDSVRAENLAGRVSIIRRHGRGSLVLGSSVGRLHVILRSLRRRFVPILRCPCGWQPTTGLVKALRRPRIAEVQLAVRDQPVAEDVQHRRTVADQRGPGPWKGHFWCRKRYDLVTGNLLDR